MHFNACVKIAKMLTSGIIIDDAALLQVHLLRVGAAALSHHVRGDRLHPLHPVPAPLHQGGWPRPRLHHLHSLLCLRYHHPASGNSISGIIILHPVCSRSAWDVVFPSSRADSSHSSSPPSPSSARSSSSAPRASWPGTRPPSRRSMTRRRRGDRTRSSYRNLV